MKEGAMPRSQTCPVCSMRREEWKGNFGKGIKEGKNTYCCEGCAIGEMCQCHPRMFFLKRRNYSLGDLVAEHRRDRWMHRMHVQL